MLLLVGFLAFTVSLNAQHIIGQISPNAFPIHSESIRWISSTPDRQITRTFRFPFNAADETRSPIIGGIAIYHNSRNGRAELRWGGPGHRFVGVDIISGRGESLNVWIEVYPQ